MMPTMDVLSLALSALALGVSLWSWRRSWALNIAAHNKSVRDNYMKVLFDVDQQLVTNPSLWSIYDTRPAGETDSQGARRAFIWLHLNLFEMVYSDFTLDRVTPNSYSDKTRWDAWDLYIRSFLEQSSQARSIVQDDGDMALLSRPFVEYLRGCMPKQQPSR